MANHRHKREANARRRLPKAVLFAAPTAAVVTAGAVSLGVLNLDPAALDVAPAAARAAHSDLGDREALSRSGSRLEAAAARAMQKDTLESIRTLNDREATRAAIKGADTKLWTTEKLNLWADPEKGAKKIGELKSGVKVLVTGRTDGDRSEVVWHGKSRWVSTEFLSETEPIPGIGGSCTNGTSVAGGVSSNIVRVHQAVCAAFPEISVYGTLRGGGGDHPRGKAVDIMVSGERGWQVAEFVRANYAALGVSYVIYSQHIWSLERGGEGWRGMSNRGSATANHYDHVHVSTY